MKPGDEDEAWRQIVENYGDAPQVEEIAAETAPPEPVAPLAPPEPEVVVPEELSYRAWDDEGRFVPPKPPPIPVATGPRLAAWVGLFGVPLLFLVLLFSGQSFPPIINLLLIGWFVGSFGYLVWHMPRTRNDPWDDGSRI
ncbi:hypothetical protein ACLM5J_15070 [Nocardioides sp. Bht2]|uniref:hypothetical protein n=1 Tax=Nocardioides sp. Bht2 TaxID=3392297 RepID=UPI0039B5F047